MSFDDVIINYTGFHPSDETHSELEGIMENLLDEAPYDSTLQAHFTTKNQYIKGTIVINSVVGPFYCTATEAELIPLVQRLTSQMLHRLKKWKSQRFPEEQKIFNYNSELKSEVNFGTKVL